MRAYFLTTTVLKASCALSHLILAKILLRKELYYLHFINEKDQ